MREAGEHERIEAEHRRYYLALAQAADRDADPSVAADWPVERLEAARWLEEALAAAPEPSPDRARALLAAAAIDLRRRSALRMVPLGTQALEIARRSRDRYAEARGLERLGMMAMGGYDWDLADRALAEGLALAEELGDDPVIVAIRQAQGALAGCRGENSRARDLLAETLDRLQEIPDERGPLFWV